MPSDKVIAQSRASRSRSGPSVGPSIGGAMRAARLAMVSRERGYDIDVGESSIPVSRPEVAAAECETEDAVSACDLGGSLESHRRFDESKNLGAVGKSLGRGGRPADRFRSLRA